MASAISSKVFDEVDVDAFAAQEVARSGQVFVVDDLSEYKGENLTDKVDTFIQEEDVVIIAKSTCPFCRDVLDLLSAQLGVACHVINIDQYPNKEGGVIHKHIQEKYNHRTVPAVFVRNQFLGGCDNVKALHAKDKLEREVLVGLIGNQRATHTGTLETAQLLVNSDRGQAIHPLFWFPNVVNNYVVRATGFQVCICSVLSAAFPNETWARYLAPALLIDFVLRFAVGAGASPLGMIATVVTSPLRPQFKPGPPKQFASFCGVFFTLMGTLFYFVEFEGHQYVACAFMAGLACASGLEWAFDFCLGCLFFSWGIMFGVFPDYVYRIYTSSKQETEDSWDYMFKDSNAPVPEKVDSDPSSPISLKYKRKTDEWTKDDFHVIRNMQVTYFAMPLAILGLSVALKMGGNFSENFNVTGTLRQHILHDALYVIVGVLGTAIFAMWCFLYSFRMALFWHKIETEWGCPLRSPSFGAISICLMLIAFIIHDEVDRNEARVLLWIGCLMHTLLTIAKLGEWIGFRHELEHLHAQWMILPVGLSVAALVGPMVHFFDPEDNDNAVGNVLIARFFQSFAVMMWVVLFAATFFKVITTHNSDNRLRHGVFIWVAAPAIIGLADYSICASDGVLPIEQCNASFVNYFFMALFLFLALCWSALPYIGFLGQEKFGMQYWIGCFALDTLAACAALFYAIYGYNATETIMLIALVVASLANLVCLLHTLAAVIRRRTVFTPEQKWGPLSFMKLTHEAIRGSLSTLRLSLETLVLKDTQSSQDHLAMFAAHFNRLCIVHDEHSKHEDEVIFKEFNDWFAKHAKKYNEDHEDFHAKIKQFRDSANQLLDASLPLEERQAALSKLQEDVPPFLDYFLEHLKGEEDNLQPIGKKRLPLEIQKQISRKVFQVTKAEDWEVIIPYIILNLPRHVQRVRYLKVLMWSMPERSQQIGAMVYRNVDAVMWERLRVEVPEMIPRGAYNWRRYY